MSVMGLLCMVASVERFTKHRLNHSLTADIQRFCLSVQFLQLSGR